MSRVYFCLHPDDCWDRLHPLNSNKELTAINRKGERFSSSSFFAKD